MEKNSILFWVLTIILFIIFFQIYFFIVDLYIPWNSFTTVVSIAIFVLFIIPLTLVLGKKLTTFILPNSDV
ncbi:hypothetical protein QA612_13940 [Evansella sp. AB-P1]|uniref:hypothetical protein n=1 Tax=Evansella sp. AB-P1 TaxID=3037653 RepID=UPI00241E4B89|nr:hypothetical protein [Evansella sp. AB-P1]MDG5788583.1 hypothetical protein [Evansella sp. AB-P1]